MRVIAVCVAILGLAGLVFGIVFISQAGSARQQVADSVSPLKLDEVNGKYDTVVINHNKVRAVVEPKIAANTASAAEMDNYNYLSSQRALLGLAKSSIGLALFMKVSGITQIIVGFGMVLAGLALLRKAPAAAM
jgi:hypothetical protein